MTDAWSRTRNLRPRGCAFCQPLSHLGRMHCKAIVDRTQRTNEIASLALPTGASFSHSLP